MSKILVTGGTSMVAKHLKEYLKDATYISSKDCDLTNQAETEKFFADFKPDFVIHLASRVGGIMDNINNAVNFFDENILMNTNVVRETYKSGCKKMISILSTCIYPDLPEDEYPLLEEDLHEGPPTKTNFTYGYAKRCMQVQMEAYNEKFGTCYSAITPCNLYSEYDHFEGDKAHFVPSLLQKLKQIEDGSICMTLMGDGTPLRQFMYADDLARAIQLLMSWNEPFHFNVCNDENLSIKQISEVAQEALGIDAVTLWESHKPNGQHRKDASSSRFLHHYPDFHFTPLKEGIRTTYRKKFKV